MDIPVWLSVWIGVIATFAAIQEGHFIWKKNSS